MDAQGTERIKVVVGLLLVVTLFSVASTQLIRSWRITYEQLTLVSLRGMAHACQMFYLVHNQYPAHLAELSTPTSNPPFLEHELIGNGLEMIKQGYRFSYQRPELTRFALLADPQMPSATMQRHFYVDESLTIRATTENREATPQDPVLASS